MFERNTTRLRFGRIERRGAAILLGVLLMLARPAQAQDPDHDLLSDAEELIYCTDPDDNDSDDDGVRDDEEVHQFHTDPLVSDTDGDGVHDGLEAFVFGTNPRARNSDGDGATDGEEIFWIGSDPLVADGPSGFDLDADGLLGVADNCPSTFNPDQSDLDGDGIGDVCDGDMDGDGIANPCDSSPGGNLKPIADANADQTVYEGTPVTLDGSASFDSNGDPLTYSWLQVAGPLVVLSGGTSPFPSFTAPFVPLGGATLTFQLVVDDGQLGSQPDATNVTVTNVNHPPIALAAELLPVIEGSIVTLDGSDSYDPDGELLTYLWIGPPAITILDEETPTPQFVAPNVGQAGLDLQFTLMVSDGIDLAFTTTTVRIENVDQPPVAVAGIDQTRDEGATVTLDGTASFDPDVFDYLTPSWMQIAGPSIVLSNPAAWTPTFVAPLGAGGQDIVLELMVYDGLLFSMPDSVTIHVRATNTPPDCSRAFASTCPAKRPRKHCGHGHWNGFGHWNWHGNGRCNACEDLHHGHSDHGRHDSCVEGLLWPPSHNLAEVRVVGVSDPDGGPVEITITGVTQDEPVSGLGHGDTSPDAVLTAGKLFLRAERAHNGNGRVYRIHFTARDSQGGQCSGLVRVFVPKNEKHHTAIDSGQSYNSFGQ